MSISRLSVITQSGHQSDPAAATTIFESASALYFSIATSRSIVHSPNWSVSFVRSPIQSGFFVEFSRSATNILTLPRAFSSSSRSVTVIVSPVCAVDGIVTRTYFASSPSAHVTVSFCTVLPLNVAVTVFIAANFAAAVSRLSGTSTHSVSPGSASSRAFAYSLVNARSPPR